MKTTTAERKPLERMARLLFLAATLLAVATAYSQASDQVTSAERAAAKDVAAGTDPVGDLAAARMIVHKSPWCGCCTAWVEQAEAAGFEVELREHDNLHAVKQELGVPVAHGSCHTAVVDGYFVEGHVPFDDIRRLLAERPDASGLTVPGMPVGSPGMEQGDVRQAFDVLLVDEKGRTKVYNHYEARME